MEGDWRNYWREHPQNPSPGESNASGQGFSPFTQESNAFQAATNLNAQFATAADPEPDVEEITSMPATTKQRGNYYPPETILICRLYLEHTHDSVVGIDQKGNEYWGAICTAYNAQRPKGAIPRDIKQIKSHFQRVAKDCKRWEALYKKFRDNWASGMSDGQIIEQTEKMWIVEFRAKFRYPYAWKVLHESKKFGSISEDVHSDIHSDKRSKGSDGHGTTTSSDQSISTRPQGQKAAKRDKEKGKKKAETSKANAQALGYMAEMVKVMGQFSRTPGDLADSMLMSKDTSQMNSNELVFHLAKVAEIKQRNNIP
ncbi:uncharacterized protein LOC131023502 [Salvia miltiorrhiza]|uniref:uncharacterized protein LOC131023502 n=1 Tax=Salvia miltiorrhiza TaxID=226208 RepID=UPI0025ACD735|nr:uncharacterized protein LOC131023502 [Salvia miltiorrhiza]